MLDALDAATAGGMDMGAMGAAFGKNRTQKIQEKAEAIRQGQAAGQEKLEAKARGVAEEFVSVFMNEVMKSMRATVHENESMHGDNGEKFFQQMLDTEHAKYMAKGSGYGLTDLIYESLMTSYRMQDVPAEQPAAQPAAESLLDAIPTEEKELSVEAIG